MKSMKMFVLTCILAFLPLFSLNINLFGFELGTKTVYADICSPGQYPDPNNNFKCKPAGSDITSVVNGDQNTHGVKYYFDSFASGLSVAALCASILMIVFAAFLYTTSDGDAKKIQQAKLIIIGAGIGVFISGGVFTFSAVYDHIVNFKQ